MPVQLAKILTIVCSHQPRVLRYTTTGTMNDSSARSDDDLFIKTPAAAQEQEFADSGVRTTKVRYFAKILELASSSHSSEVPLD